MGVVVLLEMIDVHIDASPRCIRTTLGCIQCREITAIVASGKRIANALLHQLSLEMFPARDVHEYAVKNRLTRFWISVRVPRVENCSHCTIWSRDLQLAIANG